MQVGFTGTRRGMSGNQKAELEQLLQELQPESEYFHHGDCVGSDAQAHEIASRLGYEIIIHPPENSSARAFCKGSEVTLPPLPYLIRNHRIVELCHVLIAATLSSTEEQRSGTWATVRYAKSNNRKVHILER